MNEISLKDYEKELDLHFWLEEMTKYRHHLPKEVSLAVLRRAIIAEGELAKNRPSVGAYESIHE